MTHEVLISTHIPTRFAALPHVSNRHSTAFRRGRAMYRTPKTLSFQLK